MARRWLSYGHLSSRMRLSFVLWLMATFILDVRTGNYRLHLGGQPNPPKSYLEILSFTVILIIPKQYPMAERYREHGRPSDRHHYPGHDYHRLYSPAGEGFYRGQAATQGQSSTPSLSTPNHHPQIGHAIPEMAGNVVQNNHSYSPTSSFTPNNGQSTVAAGPSVTAVAYGYSGGFYCPTGGNFYRSQIATQKQFSTPSLSTSNYRPQIGRAIPEMAGNAQNIHSYSPASSFTPQNGQPAVAAGEGFRVYRGQVVTQGRLSTPNHHPSTNVHPQVSTTVPDNNDIHVSVSIPITPTNTIRSSNNYSSTNIPPSFEDPYYNPPSFHGAQRHNPTQGSTRFAPSVIPATGSDISPPYSPPIHTPHHDSRPQWQSSAMHLLPADSGLRSQPNMRTTRSESQPRISRGEYPNQAPPTQPYQDHSHDQVPHQGSRSYTQEAPLLPCRWLEGNTSCEFRGSLNAMKEHLTSRHLSGPQTPQRQCFWEGCDYSRRGHPDVRTMRYDSMRRHVYEKHLNIKYRKVKGN